VADPDQPAGGAPEANRAEVTASAGGVLGFTSLQTLGQALQRRSDGRLRLDPSR
jgi:hypothetical protein